MSEEAAIGERLFALRDERGWTQKELAKKSSVSHTTIVHLETGQVAKPRMPTLRRLAKAFEMSVEEFVTDPKESALSYRNEAEAWLRERESRPVIQPFSQWASASATRVEESEDPLAEVDRIGLELRADLSKLLHPLTGEVGQLRRDLAETGTRRDVNERSEAVSQLKRDLTKRHHRKTVALLNLQELLISAETARLSDEDTLGALLEVNAETRA